DDIDGFFGDFFSRIETTLPAGDYAAAVVAWGPGTIDNGQPFGIDHLSEFDGTLQITATFAPPPPLMLTIDDSTSLAGPLSIGSSVSLIADTTNEPNEANVYQDSSGTQIGFTNGAGLGEVVYELVTSEEAQIIISNDEGVDVGADHDHYLLSGVMTDGNFTATEALAFLDEEGSFGTFPAGTYYLAVDAFDAAGVFGITVSLAAPPPPPPLMLTIDQVDSTSYTLGTSTPDIIVDTGAEPNEVNIFQDSAGTQFGTTQLEGGEWVYQFTTAEEGEIELVNLEGDFNGAEHDYFLLSGVMTDGNFTAIETLEDQVESGSFGTRPAGTYFLVISQDEQALTAQSSVRLDFNAPPQVPDNDLRENATPLLCDATVTVDTTLATNDAPEGSCNSGDGGMDNSVWYEITASTTTEYTIDVDQPGAFYDDLVTLLFEEADGSLTEIDCQDPSPQNFVVTVNPGETYFLKIGDWGTADGGGENTITTTCVVAGNPCPPDQDLDSDLDIDDFSAFVQNFFAGDTVADVNTDTFLDIDDFSDFVAFFFNASQFPGCPQ
ncbi:MAG: hypothetical protein AAF747_11700, partial [Planctomycetota bacterium]